MVANFPKAFDDGDVLSWDEISKRSPDSNAMLKFWDKTDAIVGGIETMRNAGDEYLPKFPSEEKDEFEFRLKNVKLTNIYTDVVEGLASKPFEEEISVEDKSGIFADFIKNVDGDGNNLTQFSAVTFFNGINAAIDWIFVDYPNTDRTKIRTKADQVKAGIRPFWTRVLARNMLEAKTQIVNGESVLVLCRILEPGSPDKVRKFIREEDGTISWILYAKSEGTSKSAVIEASDTLTIDEIPLVPFITGRKLNNKFKLLPALQGSVDLQIELYQQESDLKFAKKMTAFPMLAGNGVKPDLDEKGKAKSINVGPAKVLYAPMDGSGKAGSWSFVEPSAASLKFLAEEIKETKKDLRELGKQPLTAQSGNLTVITTAVAASKSKSSVVAWALGLKDTLETAFKITGKWLKTESEVMVSVYTEFDSFLDGDDGLQHLRELRKNGDLSRQTLHSETKRRRLLSSDFDHDKENEKILEETPTGDDI